MQVRVDKRTRDRNLDTFDGIPYVTRYKYLGVLFNDDLNMEDHLDQVKIQERKLQKVKWILEKQNQQLDGFSKYHLFQALFRSRVSYSMNLLTIKEKKCLSWFEGFWYRALKILVGISLKENVNKERLFEICLG
jgi:hypothetical protein